MAATTTNNRIQQFIGAIFLLLIVCINARQRELRSTRALYTLTADVVNSTSVSLRWTAAASDVRNPADHSNNNDNDNDDDDDDDDVECPPRLFLIRLKQEGARRVRTWKVDGARSSVSLHGLVPSTLYSVRIVSVDCQSRSRPSRWVNMRTAAAAASRLDEDAASSNTRRSTADRHNRETSVPSQPLDVSTRAYSDSVLVSWRAPEDSVPVRGYVVGYGEGVPDVSWQYMEPHRRNVTIKNLKKDTQYVISVRAFNNLGKGPVVYDLVYTTDTASATQYEPFPAVSAPTNLQSKVLSSSTVWLQWTDPTVSRQQPMADSRYYNVHYQAVQPPGKALSAVARDTHVILYNLLPATRYEFKVRTVKDSQTTSPYSPVITNRTHETAPSSSPRDVRVYCDDNDNSVTVKWRAPRHANGNITEYLVFFASNEVLPSERWQIEAVAGSQTEVLIVGLNASATFYFRVQARNSHGFGPKSDIVKYTVAPARPTRTGPGRALPTTTTNNNYNNYYNGSSSSNMSFDNDTATSLNATTTTSDDESDDNDDDDAHYDYIDTSDDLNNNNNNTASVKQKQKREPTSHELSSTEHSESVPIDTDTTSTQQQQQQQQLTVNFQSIITHYVTAFIAWPQHPPNNTAKGCVPGSRRVGRAGSGRSRVVGYQLRYGRVGDNEYVTRSVVQNVAMLDALAPNTRYVYQVKYVMHHEPLSVWTQEELLDTTPSGT